MKPAYKGLLLIVFIIIVAQLFYYSGSTGKKQETEKFFLENFKAADIDGNIVGSEIFEDYDLSMVYIWGTFCPQCVRALPMIEGLSVKYADRVNVMGLLCDVQLQDGSPNREKVLLAHDMMDANGAGFLNIMMSADMDISAIGGLPFVPTTFFVDNKGYVVGEVYVGGKSLSEWSDIIDGIL